MKDEKSERASGRSSGSSRSQAPARLGAQLGGPTTFCGHTGRCHHCLASELSQGAWLGRGVASSALHLSPGSPRLSPVTALSPSHQCLPETPGWCRQVRPPGHPSEQHPKPCPPANLSQVMGLNWVGVMALLMETEMPAPGAGLSGHSDIPAVHGDVAPGEMVISPSVPRVQDPETETDRETGTKGNPEIEKPGLPPA